MKKIIFALLLILFICIPAFSATTSPAYAHYMLGFVSSAIDYSVVILEETLPFDLDGSDVAYNSNSDTVIKGLRIGYYSLISNTAGFELTITHTPLELRSTPDPDDTGTETEIDYRLYAVADYNNTKFLSCRSDENANNSSATNKIRIASDDTHVWPEGAELCKIVNQSFYVSLDEGSLSATETKLASLKSGTYQSTIYFVLRSMN